MPPWRYLFVALSGRFASWRRRHAAQAQAASWGQRLARDRDLENIALYHRAKMARDGGDEIEDRTWSDLDLDAVFGELDRCASAVGQQVLYHRLRTPRLEEAPLRDLDALTDVFSSSPDRRSELAALLGPLMGTGALLLPSLFLTPLPGRMRLRWLYPLLGAAAVGLGLGAFFLPKLLLPWGAVLLTNTVLHLVQLRRVSHCVAPLRWVNRLISVADRVARAGPDGWSRWFPALRVDLRALAWLRRTSAWLIHDSEGSDDLGALVRQYLNAFFLLELNALAWSLRDLHLHAGALERTFDALGTIDTALSVASVRAGRRWTRPALRSGQPSLELDEAVHPLLARPVPNSLSISGGLLITGSNMSGKSTFLRTVGVNAVLAQTIFTVFAQAYRAPFFRVETAIGTTDSLLEGKSYFLAELERIRGFLTPDPAGIPHLLLLDELFRGTNAMERIAAGSAVLCHLARLPGQVLVASHDLELAQLLGDAYPSFHFRELIEDGALRFDYRLRPGPSSTKNAIALLEVLHFPREVVQEALRVAESLEARRGPRTAAS